MYNMKYILKIFKYKCLLPSTSRGVMNMCLFFLRFYGSVLTVKFIGPGVIVKFSYSLANWFEINITKTYEYYIYSREHRGAF